MTVEIIWQHCSRFENDSLVAYYLLYTVGGKFRFLMHYAHPTVSASRSSVKQKLQMITRTDAFAQSESAPPVVGLFSLLNCARNYWKNEYIGEAAQIIKDNFQLLVTRTNWKSIKDISDCIELCGEDYFESEEEPF